MRLFACVAAAALAVQCTNAWATQVPAGFELVAKAKSTEKLFQLYSWRLQRVGTAPRSPIDLIMVVADTKDFRARIHPVLKRGSASSLYSDSVCAGALVMTNGSFYIREGNKSAPLGLVRSGGKTLAKPSRRRSGGFLTINRGEISILPRAAVGKALVATDAIESSPIVVRAGTSDMRSDDGVRFDRVGIGTTSNGKTIVIGAFGDNQDSITLVEFGSLSLAAVAASGSRLKDLLAMDGGPSAHIYLPAKRRLFGYRGPAYLPNAVCLDRK